MVDKENLTPTDKLQLERAIRATYAQLVQVKGVADAHVSGGFDGGQPEVIAALITATATNYLAHQLKTK